MLTDHLSRLLWKCALKSLVLLLWSCEQLSCAPDSKPLSDRYMPSEYLFHLRGLYFILLTCLFMDKGLLFCLLFLFFPLCMFFMLGLGNHYLLMFFMPKKSLHMFFMPKNHYIFSLCLRNHYVRSLCLGNHYGCSLCPGNHYVCSLCYAQEIIANS